MKFVTVATHTSQNFELFQKSATRQDIEFDILGWGEEYTSHICKSIWLIEYYGNNSTSILPKDRD